MQLPIPPTPRPESESAESSSRVTLSTGPRGYHVITTCAIEPDHVVLVFEGLLSPTPNRYSVQVGPQLHTAATDPKAESLFINHSCAPNCRIAFGTEPGQAWLVARVPLAPGQEVTFNYLTTEWDLATPFPCDCATPSCVGWIRGARHLDEAQLARLHRELAPHLETLLRSEGRWPSASSPSPLKAPGRLG